jgi:hypothetical protein
VATVSAENQSKKRCARRKRVRYKRPLADLAVLYDVSERTLKHWTRAGKQVNDLPPLDEPALMGSWWLRVMTYKMPDKLLALAQPLAQNDAAARSMLSDLPIASPGEILKSASEFVTIAQARLRDALAAGDDYKIKLRKTDLNTALDSLAKARDHFDAGQKSSYTALTQGDIDTQIGAFMDRLALLLHKNLPRRFIEDCLQLAAAESSGAKEWDRRRHAITRAAPWIAGAACGLAETIANGLSVVCNREEMWRAGKKHADELLADLAYEQKSRIERSRLP